MQGNFQDAAHTNPVAVPQTEWLKGDLAARKSKQFVFAAYHFSDYGTTKAAKEGTTIGEWKRGRCRCRGWRRPKGETTCGRLPIRTVDIDGKPLDKVELLTPPTKPVD